MRAVNTSSLWKLNVKVNKDSSVSIVAKGKGHEMVVCLIPNYYVNKKEIAHSIIRAFEKAKIHPLLKISQDESGLPE